MKRLLKVVLCTLIISLMLPVFVSAEVKEFDFATTQKETLEEALTQEEIKYTFTHKENDKQVTIYLFRGHGCAYCHKFLEFANNTLMKDYADKVKIVSYEVWYNKGNAALMEEVASFLGTQVQGVPFYVIGNKYFPGYSEEMNEEIFATINDEYAAKEKYDVIEEYKKSIEEAKRKEWEEKYGTAVLTIVLVAVIVAIGTGVNIWFVNKKFNELQNMGLKVNKKNDEKITEVIDLEKKEIKKEPVKASTKKTTKKAKK